MSAPVKSAIRATFYPSTQRKTPFPMQPVCLFLVCRSKRRRVPEPEKLSVVDFPQYEHPFCPGLW